MVFLGNERGSHQEDEDGRFAGGGRAVVELNVIHQTRSRILAMLTYVTTLIFISVNVIALGMERVKEGQVIISSLARIVLTLSSMVRSRLE